MIRPSAAAVPPNTTVVPPAADASRTVSVSFTEPEPRTSTPSPSITYDPSGRPSARAAHR